VQLEVVLCASIVLLALIAVLTAVEIEFDARAFGEASGRWAAAFGVVMLGIVVSGVCGKEQPARVDVLFFGKKLKLDRWLRRKTKGVEKPAAEERAKQPQKRKRHIGAAEAVELFLQESRRCEVERVDAELKYGFSDIALTGHLAGLLYALSGALPPRIRLVQSVRWDGAERWEASASGRVNLWVGRVLFDVLWFMLRARRSPANAGANTVGKQSA
jgi:hypothetical protein